VGVRTCQPSVENEGKRDRSSAGRGCAVKPDGKSWHRDGVEGDAKTGGAFLGLDDGWGEMRREWARPAVTGEPCARKFWGPSGGRKKKDAGRGW
jgi:hypothetical protein